MSEKNPSLCSRCLCDPCQCGRSLAAPAGSALRRSFSQEELVTEARQWIRSHYPDSDTDTRMARLGLLIDLTVKLTDRLAKH